MKNLNEKINQQGYFNAGHYYSPIPHREDIKLYKNKKDSPEAQLPDINLNRENQKKILNDYIKYYKDLPFPENKVDRLRYFYNNDYFSYSDAIFLFSFLVNLSMSSNIISVSKFIFFARNILIIGGC